MSNRYAMIDSTQTVVNVVMWDGVTPFDVSPLVLVQSDSPQIWDTYDGANFTPGSPPPPSDSP